MILIYAFSNRWSTNISSRVLSELQKIIPAFDTNFQKIYGHPQTFFRRFIDGKQYSVIIGLGDYYGRLNRIRLETQASNRYGDKTIYPFSPITLDLNLPNLGDLDSSIFKIGSDMGNYNCNWLAYKTQLYLNQSANYQTSFHLFFHLPKRQPPHLLAANIANLLLTRQVLK